ncbi:MAG: sugar O-acetyltransferase [Akkermansia sp.]
MTEKEKMLAGLLYDAPNEELHADRMRAKELVYQFNACLPSEEERRREIITSLFGKTGEHFCVESPLRCDYGYNVEIGERFYANYNLVILDCARVVIGDDVLIGPNVSIYTVEHPIDPVERKTLKEFASSVRIGNGVWIGGSVTILSGVSIGDYAVIGAGSVVTRDIPASVVATGNPCHVIKEIPRTFVD